MKNMDLNYCQVVTPEDVVNMCIENCLIFCSKQEDEESCSAPIQILEVRGAFREDFSEGLCQCMLKHGTETSYIVHFPNHQFLYKFYPIEWCSKNEPRLQVSVEVNSYTFEVRAVASDCNTVKVDDSSSGYVIDRLFKDRITKINLFNEIFGERTPYTIIGLAIKKSEDGDAFYLVVKQPFIEPILNSSDDAREKLSRWVIDKFGVNALEGFTEEQISRSCGYLEGDWYIHPHQIALDDLKEGNIFINAKTGDFVVVDCNIKKRSYVEWKYEMIEHNAICLIPRKRFSFDERGEIVWHYGNV